MEGIPRGLAACGEESLEHGSHPSTYRPRKQILATKFLGTLVRVMTAHADDGTPDRDLRRDGVDGILEQWRAERPDLDASPIGVIGRISRLAGELAARLEVVYRENGLEPGWHDVLATLRRQGAPYTMRPSDFTGTLMLTSSGTTKRLDRLEEAGLVMRTPDPRDRRGVLISLTPAGLELIDEVTVAHLDNERDLIAALSDGEREQLAGLLRKLQLGLPPL
jgi:DNA-binding MarR family transcriptional regulator